MVRIYHHTPQLRANSERAPPAEFPFGLRSPAALRVSPDLPLYYFGAMLLLSSSFVALCVLICPGLAPLSPVLRLSFPPPPLFFSTVRGSGGGVVCRRRPAARNSPPGLPSRPVAVAIGRQWICVCVVDRNKQGRCFTRASPPVASGRLRSPPVASGRLRSPSVASGHLQSTSLAKHKRGGPGVGEGGAWGGVSVGRGALFQCTNAFWRIAYSRGGAYSAIAAVITIA